MVEKALEEN
jgi:hypothetical protein